MALIQVAGRKADHLAGRNQPSQHIRQGKLSGLKVHDGLAKLLALLDILRCFVQSSLSGTNAAGGDIDAPTVKALHRDGEPLVLRAQAIPNGDTNVLKRHGSGWLGMPAHLFFIFPVADARAIRGDEQGGYPS